MNRSKKFSFVDQFSDCLSASSFVVVMNYNKLTFKNISKFRKNLVTVDGSLSFVKNTLASIAISNVKSKGINMIELQDKLRGPVCFVLGRDPVTTSKMISDFTKVADGVKVVGGFLDGKICSVEELSMYASLPTLDVARSQILGLFSAVQSKVVRILSLRVSD